MPVEPEPVTHGPYGPRNQSSLPAPKRMSLLAATALQKPPTLQVQRDLPLWAAFTLSLFWMWTSVRKRMTLLQEGPSKEASTRTLREGDD